MVNTGWLNNTGINSPLGPPSSWRSDRALSQGPSQQVQLRQDDLPKVLRTCSKPPKHIKFNPQTSNTASLDDFVNNWFPTGPSPTPCHQLQKEEVRSHQPAAAKEEAKVIYSLGLGRIWMDGGVVGCWTLMLGWSDHIDVFETIAMRAGKWQPNQYSLCTTVIPTLYWVWYFRWSRSMKIYRWLYRSGNLVSTTPYWTDVIFSQTALIRYTPRSATLYPQHRALVLVYEYNLQTLLSTFSHLLSQYDSHLTASVFVLIETSN